MRVEAKTIRQAVFSDSDIVDVTRRLDVASKNIYAAKETIIELEIKLKYDTTVKDAGQAVTDYEVEVAFEVRQEVWVPYEDHGEGLDRGDVGCTDKNKGKPKYTNEEQRKTETRRRLVSQIGYIDLLNAVKDALRAESVIRIDLGQAHARLAAIEAENHNLRAIAGMIAGLAHESTTEPRTHNHVHVTKFETTVKLGE